MAAPVATVPEFCGVLVRSRLVPEPDVRALYAAWRSGGNTDADVDRFRDSLVVGGRLTKYQAALVQRGHADGFAVGGYTILDRLARGDETSVYKAVHPSGQVVAVKVLPASRAKDAAALARFRREADRLAGYNHPNVARGFQVGQAGGAHFVVMEHLDGETLAELLARRGRLPAAEAARLVSQALDGLQHLHEKGHLHLRLTPATLVVQPGGEADTLQATVKLADPTAPPDAADYAAPEPDADIRADVYSLGCVLFHLIAGRPPFPPRGNLKQTPTAVLPALGATATGVPPGVEAVVRKMTARSPADRHPTPAAAAEALRPYLPPDGSVAGEVDVLPAYEQWLATESGQAKPGLPAPPVPAPRPPSTAEVELVGLPGPRSLWDLDRRDFAMLAIGGTGVLLAVAAGVGLARLVKKPAPPATP